MPGVDGANLGVSSCLVMRSTSVESPGAVGLQRLTDLGQAIALPLLEVVRDAGRVAEQLSNRDSLAGVDAAQHVDPGHDGAIKILCCGGVQFKLALGPQLHHRAR